MKNFKVKEEWIVQYNLPDSDFEAAKVATKVLKDKGCTEFTQLDQWDSANDIKVRRMIGYVVE